MVELAMALALTLAGESIVLEPRTPAQSEAMCALEPEVCYSGRKFGGKSWVVCAKAFAYAGWHPGAHVGICREERAAMENTTLPVLWGEVVPPEAKAACWNEARSRLVLPNKSRIDIFGLDQANRIQGSRYGFIGCDQAEDLDLNQFEILNSCVGQPRMPWRQLLLAFNPAGTDHWAYRRYLPDLGDGLRLDKNGAPFARVVHVQPDDLMDLIPADYRARLDRMTGTWRDRLRLGLWCSFEGRVYRWDASHVIAPPPAWAKWGGYPPPDWPRVRGIDFGVENPFCCLWVAFDPEGAAYVYRQIYMSRRSLSQHALAIRDAEARELAALRASCDEADLEQYGSWLDALNLEDSFSDHARSDRLTLEEHGVWTRPAQKDILAGIDTVSDLLARGRLFVVRGSLVELDQRLRDSEPPLPACLEEEFPAYHWPTDRGSGTLRREVPVDRDNHALDALRYALHSRTRLTTARVYA